MINFTKFWINQVVLTVLSGVRANAVGNKVNTLLNAVKNNVLFLVEKTLIVGGQKVKALPQITERLTNFI